MKKQIQIFFVNHLSAQYFWGTNQLHIVLAVTKYYLKSEK